ncbi:TMEM175 family protein [Paludibacterium paludis]|uniref:DUF1211 domain-containing protein n=1 Tax=Paludibacterium paludis TaxID=1225769 RepID=A0A918UA63_9NEIS|nr:TMEM175 family protein [Paludibacterium paludis]GGY19802.1 hypothetical protein GCM10011289_24060 [Paludibacterium paludis]
MHKNRLEAFSDGVMAIILTIMVLELKVPHSADPDALRPLLPVFLSYVLSFVYVGIYWNNHHHLFHAARRVNGAILWANLHLLFWLSLIPFVTGWMGENHYRTLPVMGYGAILFMSAVAYYLLGRAMVAHEGCDSPVARALLHDVKGLASLALYAAGIALSYAAPWAGILLYCLVALLWLVPDRRIEKVLANGTD